MNAARTNREDCELAPLELCSPLEQAARILRKDLKDKICVIWLRLESILFNCIFKINKKKCFLTYKSRVTKVWRRQKKRPFEAPLKQPHIFSRRIHEEFKMLRKLPFVCKIIDGNESIWRHETEKKMLILSLNKIFSIAHYL